MALIKEVKNDFSFGEISSKLRGRYDLDIYKQGLAKMKNCFVTTQSSIINKTFGLKDEGILSLNLQGEEVLTKVNFYLKNKKYDFKDDIVLIYEVHNNSTNKRYIRTALLKKNGDNYDLDIPNISSVEISSEVVEFVEGNDDHVFFSTKEKVNGSYVNAIELIYSNSPRYYKIKTNSLKNLKDLFENDVLDNDGNVVRKIYKGPTKQKNLFFDELNKIDEDLSQSRKDLVNKMKHIIFKQDPKTKEVYISFFEERPLQNDFLQVKYKGTYKDFNGNERPMTLEEAKFYFPDIYSPDASFSENDLDEIYFPLEKDEIVQTHVAVKRILPNHHTKVSNTFEHASKSSAVTKVKSDYNPIPAESNIHIIRHGKDSEGNDPKSVSEVYVMSGTVQESTLQHKDDFISLADKYDTLTLVPIIKHIKPNVRSTDRFREEDYNLYNFTSTTISEALSSSTSKAGRFFTDQTVDFRYSEEYSTQKVGNKLLLYKSTSIGSSDHKLHSESPKFSKPKYKKVGKDRTSLNIKELYDFIKEYLNEIYIQGGIGRLDFEKLKKDHDSGTITELRYILTKMTDVHTEKVNKTTGEIEITWENVNTKLIWFKQFINVDEIRSVAFVDNRLVLMNTEDSSSQMNASSYGNNYDFTYMTMDEFDPFSFKLITEKNTVVYKIFKKKNVYILTNNGIFGALSLAGKGNVLKSTFELITAVKPSEDIEPIIINDVLIFASKNNRKLFLITTNEQGTRFKVEEVTSTNDEMFDKIESIEVVDFNYDSGFSVYCVLGTDYKDPSKHKAALLRTDVDKKINSFSEIDFDGYMIDLDSSLPEKDKNYFEALKTFEEVSYGVNYRLGKFIPLKTVTAKKSNLSLLPPSNETHNKLPAFLNNHFNSNKCEIYLGGEYNIEVIPVGSRTPNTGGLNKKYEDQNLDSYSREYIKGSSSVVDFPINFSNLNQGYEIVMRSGDIIDGEIKDRETVIYAIISYYDAY